MRRFVSTMDNVFQQLLQRLKDGRRTAVVSAYEDSCTKRHLVFEEDSDAWHLLGRNKDGLSFCQSGNGFTMVEYYSSSPRLVILGGGHIALPLSRIGSALGFRVAVYDDRPSFANKNRFPDAETIICESFEDIAKHININKSDYIIIVTRGHKHDSLCLRNILKGQSPRYVGMIGSRRRVELVKRQLEAETGETEKLAQLHAPIGIAIGAVTPGEIAISILAEIIMDMRLGISDLSGAASSSPLRFIYPDIDLLGFLARKHSERFAIATVVETEGSTPREAGAKMAVLPHGQVIGSIGGGCSEAEVMLKAVDITRKGGYSLLNVDMTDSAEEDGMVCGGTMKVLIEAVW